MERSELTGKILTRHRGAPISYEAAVAERRNLLRTICAHMLSRVRLVKRLFRDLPQYGKLAYCLVRDDRVPARNKAIFGAALVIGLNPFINLPEVIPVVGELDALAITLLALRLFISSCPAVYVEEHKQLLVEQRSRFDEDLRSGEGTASRLFERLRRQDSGGPAGTTPTVVDVTPASPAATADESDAQRSAGGGR